jgi:hypothetical protein
MVTALSFLVTNPTRRPAAGGYWARSSFKKNTVPLASPENPAW